MSELLAGSVPRPAARPRKPAPVPLFLIRPQPVSAQAERGTPAGGPGVARRLRDASRAVGDAMARLWPGPGDAQVPVLDPGPWDGPASLTPGPAGWFTLAVEAGPTGFRLGGRLLGAAELARAIWHCPRWRGRPVLLVTQPSAPVDGAGPVLRLLSADLGAPVYASDAGIRFTCGRAFSDGLFWCWRPGADSGGPEPVDRVLPPLGPVRARRGPSAATGAVEAPDPRPEPVPPPGVRPLAVPVVGVPRLDLSVRQVALPGGDLPRPDLGTRRPRATAPRDTAPSVVTPRDTAPSAVDSQAAGPVTARHVLAGAPAAEPSWFAVQARTEEADRERMRAVLGWRFQAHSRAVSRSLSMHPGLRGAVGSHDVLAGFVAVLALLDGGAGNDSLSGGSGDDDLFGQAGNDILRGGYGNDNLHGGAGNDRLFGGFGNDRLRGGDGDDYLNGGPGRDWFDGGAGADRIFARDGEVDIIFADDEDIIWADPFDRIIRQLIPQLAVQRSKVF